MFSLFPARFLELLVSPTLYLSVYTGVLNSKLHLIRAIRRRPALSLRANFLPRFSLLEANFLQRFSLLSYHRKKQVLHRDSNPRLTFVAVKCERLDYLTSQQ